MHCTEIVPFLPILGVLVVGVLGVLCWEKIRKELLLSGLIGALGLVFVVFVAVMLCDCVAADILNLLGLKEKSEALKFLGIGMGGAVLALQAVIANKRAQAMEKTATAQLKANQATEQGQRQERLKNAIEHLGNASGSVRLGGAYELFHLAEDEETAEGKKDLRHTVLDILCAHIRRTTREPEYRKDYKQHPSEEIQSLLTLLLVQEHKVFTGLHINLQGSWLNGSNLSQARLEGAILRGAQLHGAYLWKAELHGAYLWKAELHGAHLMKAELHGAHLRSAQLHGANLWKAELHEANLWGAQLHGAYSNPDPEDLSEPFEAVINKRIGKESDLSGAIFAGRLTPEDVASIGQGLPDGAANELREKLKEHIGKPERNKLPENSGASIGAYTKEEAAQWIAEY